jgi:hypothetical protein
MTVKKVQQDKELMQSLGLMVILLVIFVVIWSILG